MNSNSKMTFSEMSISAGNGCSGFPFVVNLSLSGVPPSTRVVMTHCYSICAKCPHVSACGQRPAETRGENMEKHSLLLRKETDHLHQNLLPVPSRKFFIFRRKQTSKHLPTIHHLKTILLFSLSVYIYIYIYI